jgi:hypothetical protein
MGLEIWNRFPGLFDTFKNKRALFCHSRGKGIQIFSSENRKSKETIDSCFFLLTGGRNDK